MTRTQRSHGRHFTTRLITAVACSTLIASMFGSAVFAQTAAVVEITDRLEPGTLTVEAGTTVTWHNRDGDRHRMRSTSGPVEFDSGNLEPGTSFAFAFTAVGRYDYRDVRNDEDANYFGSIVVVAEGEPVPPPEPGDPAPPPAPGDPTPPPPPPGGVTVDVIDRAYRPATVTVAVGTQVTWTNIDDRPHTVTDRAGSFDSGIFDTGGSWSRVFSDPGTFDYFCTLHPDMVATITVTGTGTDPIPPPDPGDPAPGPDPGDPAPAPAPSPQPSPQPAPPGDVTIGDNLYTPANLTIPAGTRLTWTNAGALPHTVTANGQFDSGILMPGDTYQRSFTTPGTFDYLCTIHPEMTGTITVTGTSTAAGTGATPATEGTLEQDIPADTTTDAAETPATQQPVRVATDPTGAAGGGGAEPGTVAMIDNDFRPQALTVAAGTTVVWTNDGAAPHTATAGDGTFDSAIVLPGEEFAWTFVEPGRYDYLCTLHPGMEGRIVVEAVPVDVSAQPARAVVAPGPTPGVALGPAVILAAAVLAASIAFAGGMASFGRSAAQSRAPGPRSRRRI